MRCSNARVWASLKREASRFFFVSLFVRSHPFPPLGNSWRWYEGEELCFSPIRSPISMLCTCIVYFLGLDRIHHQILPCTAVLWAMVECGISGDQKPVHRMDFGCEPARFGLHWQALVFTFHRRSWVLLYSIRLVPYLFLCLTASDRFRTFLVPALLKAFRKIQTRFWAWLISTLYVEGFLFLFSFGL